MARLTIAGEAVAGCFAFMHSKMNRAILLGREDQAYAWAFMLAHYARAMQARASFAAAVAAADVHGGEQ